ncbi:hypothetical protein L6452_34039 [Arctium lappa]|uniref:Uncharacterized protein n=1 Tax=Arctium lappa TaxID=4217 RepID=A0ACB8YI36_ARCLA|nr:hypothetical protein L6452_34039 [Arctium lappa]
MGLLLLAALSLSILTICHHLYLNFIKVPSEIQRHFRQQGVGGPTYNPISGNSDELRRLMMADQHKLSDESNVDNDHVVRQVMPHYYFWSKVYGDQFLFWFGTRPRLAITDPGMIKEVLLNTNGLFRKARVNPLVKALFGEGIVYLEGEKWGVHRKITSQAFNMERVKDLVPEIVASTKSLLDEIEAKIGGENRLELDVYKEFNNISADVISRTAFGSNFEEGKRIFEIQDQLIKIASEAMRSVYFPGFKYLPTKTNRLSWKLQRGSKKIITKIIEKNEKMRENPKALLSLLMSPYKTKGNVEKRLSLDDIVDECKTFYFAGKESTANLLTWVFLLLGSHQEWQNKAREEVVRVCGRDELPSAEHLPNFKMISMILNEALRLYPAAPISLKTPKSGIKIMPKLALSTSGERTHRLRLAKIGIVLDFHIKIGKKKMEGIWVKPVF